MSEIDVLAIETASGISVSELHGTVTGLIAGAREAPLETIVRLGSELLGDAIDPDFFDQFVEAAMEGVFDPDMSFAPLLVDENDPLGDRARDLGEWVRGFLVGFSATGMREEIDEDVVETLRDFATIAEIDDEVDEGDDAEIDFTDLYEFVRVGALVVLESS